MTVELYGYKYSVYAWIARLALHEKGVAYGWREVNPFAEDVPADYLAMHPFKRVPVLVHGNFTVYETSAITRYVDEAFDGPPLQPVEPQQRARQQQIISVIDSYAYWPLVRQVFSHGVFRPRTGRESDRDEVRRGLEMGDRGAGTARGRGHVLVRRSGVAGGHSSRTNDRLLCADARRCRACKSTQPPCPVVGGHVGTVNIQGDDARIAAPAGAIRPRLNGLQRRAEAFSNARSPRRARVCGAAPAHRGTFPGAHIS
jgi:glutathione S-transferase